MRRIRRQVAFIQAATRIVAPFINTLKDADSFLSASRDDEHVLPWPVEPDLHRGAGVINDRELGQLEDLTNILRVRGAGARAAFIATFWVYPG